MSNLSRIKCIQSMVEDDSLVYDLCCDHGIIGIGVIARVSKVYFIDRVESIITRLANTLAGTDIPSSKYVVLKRDATKYKFSNFSAIYIIAGIGGDLAIEIIKNILAHDSNPSFIINVNKNTRKLRLFLNHSNFKLYTETLVKENGIYYEIFKVSKSASEHLSEIGSKMWQQDNPELISYVDHKIAYYENSCKYSNEYSQLLRDYKKQKNLILNN